MNARLLPVLALVLVSLSSNLSSASEPEVSARSTKVVLADLPEGEPLATLHARNNVIYDGDLVLPVDLARPLRLLGRISGDDYAVQTIGSSGYYGKLFRVDHETGEVVRFGRSYDLYREPRIMRGGRYLAMNNAGPAPSKFGILDTETGEFVTTRHFPGYSEMIDAAGSRVLVQTEDPSLTAYWFPFKNRVRVLPGVQAISYQGDAKHGLLSVVVADEYRCAGLVQTKHPDDLLWGDCEGVAVAFSPDGTKAVTTRGNKDFETTRIQVRLVADGSLLHSYDVDGLDPDPLHWDGDDHIAFVVHPKGSTAAVRCDLTGVCERVTEIVDEPRYLPYQLDWSFPSDREGYGYYDESFYYDDY